METDLASSNLIIYNILGKEVRTISKLEDYVIQIDKESLTSGIYIVKLVRGMTVYASVKMLVE